MFKRERERERERDWRQEDLAPLLRTHLHLIPTNFSQNWRRLRVAQEMNEVQVPLKGDGKLPAALRSSLKVEAGAHGHGDVQYTILYAAHIPVKSASCARNSSKSESESEHHE